MPKNRRYEKLYDFTLMQGGGEIKGWLLDDKSADQALAALDRLADLDAFNKNTVLTKTLPGICYG